jgi:hypothetical protein
VGYWNPLDIYGWKVSVVGTIIQLLQVNQTSTFTFGAVMRIMTNDALMFQGTVGVAERGRDSSVAKNALSE